jgi:hypothetical protein
LKIILELEIKELPKSCLYCPICYYEVDDNEEYLYCVVLSNLKNEQIEGSFIKRREDCPLKIVNSM